MKLRDATVEDLAALAARNTAHEPKEYPATVNFLYALEDDGKVLAGGGLQLLTPTTAWAVLMLDPDAKMKIVEVYRHIRDWLAEMMKTHGIRRVQAAVRADFPEGIRTARHLDFHQEGVMRCFYGDVNGLLFVRFAEEN